MQTAAAPALCDDEPIWRVWLSAFHAPSLAVADELGIFRVLAERPATAEEIATTLKIQLRAIESLTALLASLDLLTKREDRFHLTPVARQCLVPTSPFYWGAFLRRIREIPIDCSKLIESLRRGTAAADGRVTSLWETSTPSPERLRDFTHAMHCHSFALAVRVVSEFALSNVERVLDVAGGSGSFSIAIAKAYPGIRCSLLDLPAVCEVAQSYVEDWGLADRIDIVPTNMFLDAWPPGDRVFFNDIFHDWDDDQCRMLAERAFAALPSGGRILVHEMLLADGKDGPLNAAAYSMVMVFVAQGRQRTAAELVRIISAAGFCEPTVKPTAGGYALVEAVKP